MNNISPLWEGPVTAITGPLLTQQRNKRCRDFEMNYMECLDAYGVGKGKIRCKDYYEDLRECLFLFKTMKRFHAMRWERRKQFYKGERSWDDYYSNRADGSYFGAVNK